MQGLHHQLKLLDSRCWVVGIGRVAALRHVVVHGVVAPVVLWLLQACLVHRTVVVTRQNVYGRYAELLQVVYGPRLGQRQKLALMLGVGSVDGEVAVVHLVDDQVAGRLHHGPLVEGPSFRVGGLEVEHVAPLSVHADRRSAEAGRLLALHSLEGVEPAAPVALYLGPVVAVVSLHLLHLYFLCSLAARALFIESECHFARIGRSHTVKHRDAGRLIVASAVCNVVLSLCQHSHHC